LDGVLSVIGVDIALLSDFTTPGCGK